MVIDSATNATKEAVVTRTILANLTSAQKEITTNAPHAIPALFSIPTPEASASILSPMVSGKLSYLN